MVTPGPHDGGPAGSLDGAGGRSAAGGPPHGRCRRTDPRGPGHARTGGPRLRLTAFLGAGRPGIDRIASRVLTCRLTDTYHRRHDRGVSERDEGVEDAAPGPPADRAGRDRRRRGLLAGHDVQPGASSGSAPSGAAADGEAVTLNIWTVEGEEEFLPKIKDAFEAVPSRARPSSSRPCPRTSTGPRSTRPWPPASRRTSRSSSTRDTSSKGTWCEVGEVLKERGCRSVPLRAGTARAVHPGWQAVLHGHLHRRPRAHVQQGHLRQGWHPVPLVHDADDGRRVRRPRQATDGPRRRPGQEGVGRRGGPDLLVDRPGGLHRSGRPRGGRRPR